MMKRGTQGDRETIVRALLGYLSSDDVARMASVIQEVSATAKAPGEERLERLLGPRPSPQRRLGNEFEATVRAFEKRRQLLGDSLTATQVARLLGVSRETVYARAERGELLSAIDGGQRRFPRWQFDALSDDGLVPGLRRVVKELGARPALAKIDWLTAPRPSLEARPLDVIRSGHAERLIPSARRFALGE